MRVLQFQRNSSLRYIAYTSYNVYQTNLRYLITEHQIAITANGEYIYV